MSDADRTYDRVWAEFVMLSRSSDFINAVFYKSYHDISERSSHQLKLQRKHDNRETGNEHDIKRLNMR